MYKGTLQIGVSNKGKRKATLIKQDGNKIILVDFNFADYKEGDSITVAYKEETVKLKRIVTRYIIYKQSEIIYDSHPEAKAIVHTDRLDISKEEASTTINFGRRTKLIQHIKNIPHNRTATAPYNFVPLNETVIEAEEICDYDSYHSGRFTGYIDLTIETKTPLYIRGTLSEEDLKNQTKSKDKSDFFAPGGYIQIPGSSLRGMVRNLIEITSWSKFRFYKNREIYFRGLADQSNLNDYYHQRMVDTDKKGVSKYKISAGFLNRERFKYYLIPATKNKNGKQFKRYDGSNKLQAFKFLKLKNGNYIIRSGRKINKEHQDKDVWEIFSPDFNADRITLTEKDIYNYLNDSNRSDKVNLVKDADKNPIVPCFYVHDKDRKSIAIGHTALFRINYNNTIADLIPTKNDEKGRTDIASSIFGEIEIDEEKNGVAGRVFFENAYLRSPINENVLLEEKTPQTLLNPRSTTFQHYLVQTDSNKKRLHHYDSENTTIRGYKLYWHQEEADWYKDSFNQNIDTKIKAIKKNVTFNGKLRFENLTKVELGALLFSLNLPVNCCHKLGMGKPLGLGSIRITPRLFISERKKRYQDLFAEWDKQIKEENDFQPFIDIFEKYIFEKLEVSDQINSLWDVDRMQELLTLLDFENKPARNDVKYMDLADFKDRKVLPLPSEVKGN